MLETLSVLTAYWPYVLVGLFVLIAFYQSAVNVPGDKIAVMERRWIGKEMPDGRTVALRGEVGVQAKILGPGFHFITPFIFKIIKHPFRVIGTNKIGVVRAITGVAIPTGKVMADAVDCDLFQDGEAFLKNGGQKGPQLTILPDGEYRINPHLFIVDEIDAIIIEEDEVGIVESIAGAPVTRPGGNFGSPVECDKFQNAEAFLKNGGQKGPQIAFLESGFYRINELMFKVTKKPVTIIEGGMLGLIEATDGARIPESRLLAKKIEGHNCFYDGQAFIQNGGEKGRQLEVLMPGVYRLNSDLFKIVEVVEWTLIDSDEVGIVTVNDGAPLTDILKIAADELDLNVHNNYQDAASYLNAGGQKGLQIPVLRAGNYVINPWFASVAKKPMTIVAIGSCAVVTSFVGADGEDTTKDDVNAKIVPNGFKGIWAEPLQPGKHPINTEICKVDIVPTTQILLSWANSTSSAHKLDSNLKTITLRTKDAFSVNMDVNVIVHIRMTNASKVIANLGSVENMISQVLEPAISAHFRNAAQYIPALDLYSKREELQQKAKEHISKVLSEHHIDSKDTLISDVVLPENLTKPVIDREIAEQEKKTFAVQQEAQVQRRALANATAQADMQKEVVDSERNVEIEKNKAEGAVATAEGQKKSKILSAEGEAESVKLAAGAEAEAVRIKGVAQGDATLAIGKSEAEVILEKGKSTAEAYRLEVAAMGQGGFVQVKVMEEIGKLKLKLIPDNLIIGGGGENGQHNLLDNFMGLSLIEKLTGKALNTPTDSPENKSTDQLPKKENGDGKKLETVNVEVKNSKTETSESKPKKETGK